MLVACGDGAEGATVPRAAVADHVQRPSNIKTNRVTLKKAPEFTMTAVNLATKKTGTGVMQEAGKCQGTKNWAQL